MTNSTREVVIKKQSWALEKEFRISRGARIKADVVLVCIVEDDIQGRSEVVPTARNGETIESVITQIESLKTDIENGLDIERLNKILPAGAARNALDCALWDLRAKKYHSSVAKLNLIKPFSGCETAQTLSIDTPQAMAKAAALLKHYPLIKVKFDTEQVVEKMRAIFDAAPDSRFIIDANEAWNIEQLNRFTPVLSECNVALIEQPLAAASDSDLKQYTGCIPLCADESIHTTDDLDRVKNLYSYINIKLDKTGGLSEALKLMHAAKEKKLGIMIGCMVGTSLAMAPAALLASYADFVDLDGPALLAKDREFGFKYNQGRMSELNPKLWGGSNEAIRSDSSFRFYHSGM